MCVCVCRGTYWFIIFSCSKCYHSLVDLLIGSGSNRDMASKEQAWDVLEEVMSLIDSRQDKVQRCL